MNETKSNKSNIDCFGHIIEARNINNPIQSCEDDNLIRQFGLEIDKETGSTKVIEKDPINLTELIESYRDTCGVEYARKMIARGVNPEKFADNGTGSGDFTGPTDINTAFELAKNGSIAGAKLANALGLDFNEVSKKSGDDLTNYIVSTLKANAAAAAATETKEGKE